MTHRKEKSALSRLYRIERKCDIILSRLAAMTQGNDAVDVAIDRLHDAAKALREQSSMERDFISEFFRR